MIRNVGAAQFRKSPGRCPVFYYFRNSIFSKLEGFMIRNVGAAQFRKSPGRCPVFYYFRNSIFSKLNRVSKIVKAVSQDGFLRFCDPGGIRTPNQQNRNLSFYPIELRSRKRRQM